MRKKTKFDIIWRNPEPPHRHQRWEQINRDSQTARYLVEEFSSTSDGFCLTTTSSLEVVQGGCAA
jgi:hypothetical protein